MTLTASATTPDSRAETSVPRPEYPRPQFDRSERWQSLNGVWDFRRGEAAATAPDAWPEQITVPFAWETPASGVEAHWLEHATYRCGFGVDPSWVGERVILQFGAVHHEADVWVDGVHVGNHVGGYTPFEFDITDALGAAPEHELVVHVTAPNDKLAIAHGKQRTTPRDDYDGCAFEASSGIWQSVWLEPRPATYLAELQLRATDELDGVIVSGAVADSDAGPVVVSIDVQGADAVDHAAGTTEAGRSWTGDAAALRAGMRIAVPSPRLWSPDDPFLYRVRVEVTSADGIDVVTGTTGLRKVETRGGMFFLNGRRISLRGVLDQGYWPNSGITAPSDDAFVHDLRIAQQAGFNLVRKHLKLEDPRFHHHADRLGVLVWAEPASTGRYSEAATRAFSAQIAPMVARDGNHPSIVVWGLYNEEWGLDWDIPGDAAKQDAVRADYRALKALDPTRPVVDNSGWAHVETDIVDWHIYDEHPKGWADKLTDLMSGLATAEAPAFPVGIDVGRVVPKKLLVEGPMPSHLPFMNSEFGGGWTSLDRGWNLHWQTQELRRYDRIAGWVWTELYDIEHESAGIVDVNRRLKDHGGRPPLHANAETATVFNLAPVGPGRDVVSASGTVAIPVAVSHHGASPLEVEVTYAWGPVYSLEPATERQRAGSVHVEPFELSGEVTIAAQLPEGAVSGRLHVLLSADGAPVGRGAVDVVRE